MKNKFFQYHISDYIDDIYKDALIVFDANSLLNLYRYNTRNREKYFEIIDSLEDRLILPYQVGLEFYKNRINLIKQRTDFKNIIKKYIEESLEKLINVIESGNGSQEYNAALTILRNEVELKENIINIIEKSKKEILEKIDENNEEILEDHILKEDPILNKINEIFHGKVNEEFSREELTKIYKDGEKRYKDNIPPGYKDISKDTPNKYGDLVIWKEMINISKVQGKDILFVSDDRKEDWALKHNNIDLGPRKELIKEFYLETGKYFYSVTTKEFIKQMSIVYNIEDTDLLEKQTDQIQSEILNTELRSEISEYIKTLQPNLDLVGASSIAKQLGGIQSNLDLGGVSSIAKQLGGIQINLDLGGVSSIVNQLVGIQSNLDLGEAISITKQFGEIKRSVSSTNDDNV
ncbi:MAG: DUF4935 domain-containing protein [Tissierella sp.]|nr:DUF4935 domain-containing protein [Tissierella sp.]